jgi:hypothetical protein
MVDEVVQFGACVCHLSCLQAREGKNVLNAGTEYVVSLLDC